MNENNDATPVKRPLLVAWAIILMVSVLAILSAASTTLLAAGPDDEQSDVEAASIVVSANYDARLDSFTGYRECLTGTTTLQLYHTAILTTTIDTTVPQAGKYQISSDISLSTNLPVLIDFDNGAPSLSTTISLSGQEQIYDQMSTSTTTFYYVSTDQPLMRGTKDVGQTGCMTISTVGTLFSGTASAQLTQVGSNIVYLPIIYGPQPTVTPSPGYYDDFSNTNSGWPRGQYGNCSYDYYYDYRYDNWYYRITADNQERCIIPAPSWATQTDGTFEILASRPGYTAGMYGFFFRAGTDADRNRWAVEVRPDPVACGNLPFYWLSYINNGSSKLLNPGAESCTGDLNLYGGWNKLTAVTQGSTVYVYLNDHYQMSGSGGPYGSQYKYFDLEAIADTNTAITVYIDWVKFTPN